MTSYINGFSASAYPSSIGIRSYRVPGTGTYLPVRNEIAPLLIGLASEFNRSIQALHTGWCWGYSYRAQTGGAVLSYHSAGIAIDLNAPLHPYCKRYTFSATQRERCRAVARKYGCRWGGDYRSCADEMHFEIIVSRTTALNMVRQLQQGPTAQAVRRDVYYKKLDPGQKDSLSVKFLQRELNRRDLGTSLQVDGDYGKSTVAKVKRWEAKQGWNADGDVGKEGASRLFHDHDNINYTIHW